MFRIFEESLRVDSSVHIFGLRLNMYVAIILTIVGLVWFYRIQRRPAADPAPSTAPADAAAAGAEPADGAPTADAQTSDPVGASAQPAAEAKAAAAPEKQAAEGPNAEISDGRP
jgi:cytoskeletal protein RodZ